MVSHDVSGNSKKPALDSAFRFVEAMLAFPRLLKGYGCQVFCKLNVADLVAHIMEYQRQVLIIYASPRRFLSSVRSQQSRQDIIHFYRLIRGVLKSITQ
jgi:hypothetical protein